jgi:surface polysaccharide O-acyltransferase-like enzyme
MTAPDIVGSRKTGSDSAFGLLKRADATDAASVAAARAFAPDALKAFAIFGVIYIHCRNLAGETPPVEILGEVFRIAVPLFIIIWAYFQERAYLAGRPAASILRSKFVAVAVPFLAWSLLYFLLTADWTSLTLRTAITRHWLGSGWSGQYFLIILFQLILVFPLLRRMPADALSLGLIFGLFAAAFAVVDPFSGDGWIAKLSYRPFVYWLPYVLLGIHLARNPDRVLPPGAAVLGAVLIVAEAALSWRHAGFDSGYTKPGVLIGAGLMAAAFLNRAAAVGPVGEALRPAIHLIGRNTMGMFLINPLISVIAVPAVAQRIGSHGLADPAASVAVSLLIAAAVLALCLCVTVALKRLGLRQLVG